MSTPYGGQRAVGVLAATATCLSRRCDWTAGPGPWQDIDRAADKHTRAGHPTMTCAEPKGH